MIENKKVFARTLAGLALSGFMSTAMAAPPILMETFEDSFGPFIDPDASALCGFDVLVTFKEKGKFTLFADNTARVHANREIVFSNPATGAKLIETQAVNQVSPPEMEIIDEDARTRTVIFMNTFNGVPFKWRKPGTGVLLLDAGNVTFQGTVVWDLDTGAFLSFSEEITALNGPHPSLFLSFDQQVAIGCGALQ